MTLIDFIVKANLSVCASGGEGKERKFGDGSAGFEIISDGFKYVDRYSGFNPFAGSDQIFNSTNALLWVMNYFGEVLVGVSDLNRIYSFLKKQYLKSLPNILLEDHRCLKKEISVTRTSNIVLFSASIVSNVIMRIVKTFMFSFTTSAHCKSLSNILLVGARDRRELALGHSA